MAILSLGQMTTDDVLGSEIQLNELLDISSGDTFTSLGDAILDDMREGDINGFQMHAHLILPVGVIIAIKDWACSGHLDYPCSLHT